MRHRVEIQSLASSTLDSYGRVTQASSSDWNTDYIVQAKIMDLRGEEAALARQIYPRATSTVSVDYISALDSTGATRRRVKFGSRYLYVGYIRDVDNEHFVHQLVCGEER